MTLQLHFAWKSLIRTPVRTLLSGASVALALAGVTILLSIGSGARLAMIQELDRMGRHLLVINAATRQATPLRGETAIFKSLDLEDVQTLTHKGIQRSAPVCLGSGNLRRADQRLNTTLMGTVPAMQDIKNYQLVQGRFLADDDLTSLRRVAVIGQQVVADLFAGEFCLGEGLMINKQPYRIIGILEARGLSPDGTNEDNLVLIPLSSAMQRMFKVTYLSSIFIQATSEHELISLEKEIEQHLRFRHGLAVDVANDFNLVNQSRLVALKRESRTSMSQLMTGLAAASLVLSCVGLCCVNLLAVGQRRNEIGLRLALGAQPGDLFLQFLLEALLLAMAGAVMGLSFAGLSLWLALQWTHWPLSLNLSILSTPLLASMLIGLISGLWPAVRASRLEPITALRCPT